MPHPPVPSACCIVLSVYLGNAISAVTKGTKEPLFREFLQFEGTNAGVVAFSFDSVSVITTEALKSFLRYVNECSFQAFS